MIATLVLTVGLLAQVGSPAGFQPARDVSSEVVDTLAADTVVVSPDVEDIMGPAKGIVALFMQFLSRTGVTEAWLMLALANTVFTTMFFAGLLGIPQKWIPVLDGVWAFGLAANHFLPNLTDFIAGGLCLTAIAVILDLISRRGGAKLGESQMMVRGKIKARGMFNRGPSVNTGGDQ